MGKGIRELKGREGERKWTRDIGNDIGVGTCLGKSDWEGTLKKVGGRREWERSNGAKKEKGTNDKRKSESGKVKKIKK